MSLGPWQLVIIAVVILVLFGRGRISEMMGDFGKGINSFKKGMSEDEKAEKASGAPSDAPQPSLESPAKSTADVDAKSKDAAR